MTNFIQRLPRRRSLLAITGVTLVAAAALAACGGGGDSGTSVLPPPSVTNVSTSASPMYSGTLTITLTGANLVNGLTVSATGCNNLAVSTTAPYVTSATTAYYQCTVAAVGAQTVNVLRSSDSSLLGSVGYTVATPQVTMAVGNGAGVQGNLLIALNPTAAPATVANFLNYVNSGFYTQTIFHRVSPGFVIQGGGYTAPVTIGSVPTAKATNAPIALETTDTLVNAQYTIAMARTNDANSATSQFFINLIDNSTGLPPASASGYAVFGSITADSQALVQAIAAAPCQADSASGFLPAGDCLPIPNMVITSALQTQ